jgi:hypothetical protein
MIGWIQWAVILVCFYVIYWRLPAPHLFDGFLNDILKELGKIARKQDILLERIAAAKSADAQAVSGMTPVISLVRGHGEEAEKWFAENHGLGPAINLQCSYSQSLKPSAGSRNGEASLLVVSLQRGDRLPLPHEVAAQIDESLARSIFIEEKTRDLAAQGYRYRDLYGDADFTFEVTFRFESVTGDRYSTTTTWPKGKMKMTLNGYSEVEIPEWRGAEE